MEKGRGGMEGVRGKRRGRGEKKVVEGTEGMGRESCS